MNKKNAAWFSFGALVAVSLISFRPYVQNALAQSTSNFIQTVVGTVPSTLPANNLTNTCVYSAASSLLPGQAIPIPCGSNGQIATGTASLAYTLSSNASVGTSSAVLITAGQTSRALQISTLPTSTTNVWLNVTGGTSVAGSGIVVQAGGGSVSFGGPGLPIPTTSITAITDGTSAQSVLLVGG